MKNLLKKALERNQETKERYDLIKYKQELYDIERDEKILEWKINNH